MERNAWRRQGLVLFASILIVNLPVAAIAQTAYEASRLDTLRLFGALYRDGRTAEAETVLARYLRDDPCDAVMTYNLACLVSLRGDLLGASGFLDRALGLGYEPLDGVLDDADLRPLRAAGILEPLLDFHRSSRAAARADASAMVIEGEWTPAVRLAPESLACAENVPQVEISFTSDPDGLRLRVRPIGAGSPEQWFVDFLVGTPRGPDTWATDRVRMFSGPLDAALQLVRWNRSRSDVDSLLTRPTADGGAFVHRISWTDLPGIGPPLDAVVAVNVRVRDADDPLAVASLVPDPFVGSSTVSDRRHTDLTILPADEPVPWVRARPASHGVVGDSLAVDVAAQGLAGGEVDVEWTVRHVDPVSGDVTVHALPVERRVLEPDISFFGSTLGLADLPTGSLSLELELRAEGNEFPGWTGRILRLDTDWFLRGRRRLDALDRPVERSIVEFRLFRVLESLRAAHADDPVGDLAEQVGEVERLLARVERTGSALPPPGDTVSSTRVAFPAGGTAMAPGLLIRPPRSRADAQGSAVLRVQPVASGRRVPGGGEIDRGVLLEIEVSDRITDPEHAPRRIAHAADWLKEWSETEAIVLSAHGDVLAPATRYALAAEGGLGAVHLFVDRSLDPWPGASESQIRALAAQAPAGRELYIGHREALDESTRNLLETLRSGGVAVQTAVLEDDAAVRRFLAGAQP